MPRYRATEIVRVKRTYECDAPDEESTGTTAHPWELLRDEDADEPDSWEVEEVET